MENQKANDKNSNNNNVKKTISNFQGLQGSNMVNRGQHSSRDERQVLRDTHSAVSNDPVRLYVGAGNRYTVHTIFI